MHRIHFNDTYQLFWALFECANVGPSKGENACVKEREGRESERKRGGEERARK